MYNQNFKGNIMDNKLKKNQNESRTNDSSLSREYLSLISNPPKLQNKYSVVSFIKKLSNFYKKHKEQVQ